MNTAVTSKEEILKISRELIRREGWSAVNIRSVAAGLRRIGLVPFITILTPRPTLVGAAVESVWEEIFHRPEGRAVFQDTQACIIWLYDRMEYGCKQYPGFFSLHALAFMGEDKSDGRRRMERTRRHILQGLSSVLQRDARVRPDAFSGQLTAEKFADLLFSLMLSALLRQDCDPTAVLEIVRRTLY